MRAITVRDRDAGAGGLSLTDMPYPHAAENDVIVRVHAAGFTSGELDWPGTWTDRAGGGDILDRSTALVRASGTLVTIAAPPKVRPEGGRAIFFVVEPDRARLADLAERVRDGRLKPIVGAIRTLPEATAAFGPDRRTRGKTIIRVTGG